MNRSAAISIRCRPEIKKYLKTLNGSYSDALETLCRVNLLALKKELSEAEAEIKELYMSKQTDSRLKERLDSVRAKLIHNAVTYEEVFRCQEP